MDMNFMLAPANIVKKQAVSEILNCNEYTACYGLSLTTVQALELVKTRTNALVDNGRIEFGSGVIDKLIKEFCDSSFISQYNYEETLQSLIETFYYYKNESLDKLSDDELITSMKEYFETSCKGSIDLLQNRELENLARDIRFENRKIKEYAEYESTNEISEDDYE